MKIKIEPKKAKLEWEKYEEALQKAYDFIESSDTRSQYYLNWACERRISLLSLEVEAEPEKKITLEEQREDLYKELEQLRVANKGQTIEAKAIIETIKNINDLISYTTKRPY
jgi:hypothetical protein